MKKVSCCLAMLLAFVSTGCEKNYTKKEKNEMYAEFKEAAANFLNYNNDISYEVYSEYSCHYEEIELSGIDNKNFEKGVYSKDKFLISEHLGYNSSPFGWITSYSLKKEWIEENDCYIYWLSRYGDGFTNTPVDLDSVNLEEIGEENINLECYQYSNLLNPSWSNLWNAVYFSFFDSFEELNAYFENFNIVTYDFKNVPKCKNQISFSKDNEKTKFKISYFSSLSDFCAFDISFENKRITNIEYELYNFGLRNTTNHLQMDLDFDTHLNPITFNKKNSTLGRYDHNKICIQFFEGDHFSLKNRTFRSSEIENANVITLPITIIYEDGKKEHTSSFNMKQFKNNQDYKLYEDENFQTEVDYENNYEDKTVYAKVIGNKARLNLHYSYDKKYSLFGCKFVGFSFMNIVRDEQILIGVGEKLRISPFAPYNVSAIYVDGVKVDSDYTFDEEKYYDVTIECTPTSVYSFCYFSNN